MSVGEDIYAQPTYNVGYLPTIKVTNPIPGFDHIPLSGNGVQGTYTVYPVIVPSPNVNASLYIKFYMVSFEITSMQPYSASQNPLPQPFVVFNNTFPGAFSNGVNVIPSVTVNGNQVIIKNQTDTTLNNFNCSMWLYGV